MTWPNDPDAPAVGDMSWRWDSKPPNLPPGDHLIDHGDGTFSDISIRAVDDGSEQKEPGS